ncbi:hypothetical protein EON68_03150 [archaeon]|nr:MAG: hypothetical protein EON68_03150 [archaeon]
MCVCIFPIPSALAPVMALASRLGYARRAFASAAAAAGVQPKGVQTLGVVGLGLMGHGIVQTAAAAGIAVVAVDTDSTFVTRGMGMIQKSLDTIASKAVAKGTLTADVAAANTAAVLARITTSTTREALNVCDLVVEAVPETMAAKKPVYKDFAAILRPDAIIASNTSGLSVKELADLSGRYETTVCCVCTLLGVLPACVHRVRARSRTHTYTPVCARARTRRVHCRLVCTTSTPCNS